MASPIPPQLLAALAAAHGAAGGSPQSMGGPMRQEGPGEEAGEEAKLKQALALIRSVIAAEEPNDKERLMLEKVTTGIQQVLAQRETEQNAALGGGPATNYLQRTVGGR